MQSIGNGNKAIGKWVCNISNSSVIRSSL